MEEKDDREVIAQIGNVRIVRGDSWWDGNGGKWAVRIVVVLVALVWLVGVVTVVWAIGSQL